MSIRLRRTPDAGLIALCAARSVEQPGDVYLDDAAHYALAQKFWIDHPACGITPFAEVIAATEREESNNPNRTDWDHTFGGADMSKPKPDSAAWWRQVAQGLARDFRALKEESCEAIRTRDLTIEVQATSLVALEDDAAKWRAHVARKFPIMDGPAIPWASIEPFEHMAQKNHCQTLERLAERGGLDVHEALHIIKGVRWRTDGESSEIRAMSKSDAIRELQRLTAAAPPRSRT